MLYRITIDLFFKDATEALDIKNFLMNYQDKFTRARDELSTITVHKCYHDEYPPRPCEEILFSYKLEDKI